MSPLKEPAMCAEAVRPPRVARPARPAVPPLPTLDALDCTHAQMMVTLSQLGGLMRHLRDTGVDETARRNAAEICAFFVDTARQHHADEERAVFPALLASDDAQLRAHVQRLQQDHGWLEEDWIELAPQLQAVAQGYSWYDIDELSHAVQVFVDLYHEHIALEESMIYPAARRRAAVAQAGIEERRSSPA
jgi:hemerythrin-like domain-containing protein